MKRSMLTFYMATLLPLPLLVAAGVLGGYWTLAACMYLTTFVFLLDELIGYAAEDAAPGTEFPAGRGLSAFLGVIHIPVLFLAVATVSGATGQSALEQVGAFIAFGIWFGHVAYSNAHELIHRTNPTAFRLGALVYGTTFYGHHVTAHRFIHHTFVGSDRDPNTSRLGESFYRFAIRAWGRAFVEGFRIETDRLRRRGQSAQVWRHPYFGYFLINVGMLGSIFVLFSWSGIAAYLAISVYATAQILLADYVQHYGLRREEVAPGKLE
ncbi:MAG: fatty acid desaturase, partial [Pseudomonadota bacterium]